jgi:hypothetical protein
MQVLTCTKCAEQWDFESFHSVDGMDFRTATDKFRSIGCKVFGQECDTDIDEQDIFRAEVSSLMMDLLGDDLDGVASMMDDFEYLGLI